MKQDKEKNTLAIINHMLTMCNKRLKDESYSEIWPQLRKDKKRLKTYMSGDIITLPETIKD
jgi:hypothetical protein